MWVKISVSFCGAFPLNKCLEIHLQNGSVLCIWSKASNLSAVRDLGVWFVSGEMLGVTSRCGVKVVPGESLLCEFLYCKKVHWCV